jgi:hypothetical protein
MAPDKCSKHWILAPIRIESQDGFLTAVSPENETIQRAMTGHRFASAEEAMTWLELIGYPEDECSSEYLAAADPEKE